MKQSMDWDGGIAAIRIRIGFRDANLREIGIA
jgi:hypothetical protein